MTDYLKVEMSRVIRFQFKSLTYNVFYQNMEWKLAMKVSENTFNNFQNIFAKKFGVKIGLFT
jgi:phenylalanyl-tRNA synthetase beta subunit